MPDNLEHLFEELASSLEYNLPKDVDEWLQGNLRGALEDALDDSSTLDEMWQVFRDRVTDAILSRGIIWVPTQRARANLIAQLWISERNILIEKAALHLAKIQSREVIEVAARLLLKDSKGRALAEEKAVQLLSKQMEATVREEVFNTL